MTTQERFYTLADLRAMPDDGIRRELHHGELVEMNPPAHRHALLSGEIFGLLFIYNKTHNAGIVMGSDGGYLMHTDPDTGKQTVLIPDVSFVSKARETKNFDDLFVGAPDLAVEIISPSETSGMIVRKLQGYFAYGTRMVWLVYPDAQLIEVYVAADQYQMLDLNGTLDGGDVLPSFTLSVRDVFAVLKID